MNFKLIMFREDGTRRDFPLKPGVTMIGRKDDCAIRIPLADVSRHHCEVLLDGETMLVRDLGAANGTYLNNRRIQREEELEPADQIRIGPVVFTVQINGEPSDAEILAIRTKLRVRGKTAGATPAVGTSKHVYVSEDEVDPIAALEALASSADQTAINPEEEDE
ncbi:MAG: FHA domain-containing protein [Planctomycetes bacterium]|nr:FHA domain-containing protein [Planctomycetota bacterium]